MSDIRTYTHMNINNTLTIRPYWETQDLIDSVKEDIWFNGKGIYLFITDRIFWNNIVTTNTSYETTKKSFIEELQDLSEEVFVKFLVANVAKSKTAYYKKGMEYPRGGETIRRAIFHIYGLSKIELENFLIKQGNFCKVVTEKQTDTKFKYVCFDESNSEDLLKIDKYIVNMIEDTKSYGYFGRLDYGGLKSKENRTKLANSNAIIWNSDTGKSFAYMKNFYFIDDKHVKYEIPESVIKRHPDESKKYIDECIVKGVLDTEYYFSF